MLAIDGRRKNINDGTTLEEIQEICLLEGFNNAALGSAGEYVASVRIDNNVQRLLNFPSTKYKKPRRVPAILMVE